MTHEAVVRFAAAYDARHFLDGAAGVRPDLVVSHDALTKIKPNEPTPVVIDHNPALVVGHVTDTYVADDVDYGTRVRRWHFAVCELDEKPEWLKRGCGVSWSYHTLSEYKPTLAREMGTTVLASCVFREISLLTSVFREISLLTPSTAPAEPLARVCFVRPKPAAEREQVIHGGPTIFRPAIGRVLRVR